jgi:hypothetical protein
LREERGNLHERNVVFFLFFLPRAFTHHHKQVHKEIQEYTYLYLRWASVSIKQFFELISDPLLREKGHIFFYLG